MSRAKYQWGAKQYLASFAPFESRLYDERFPWRSLASIACRMKRLFGVRFAFKSNKKKGIRTIERVF